MTMPHAASRLVARNLLLLLLLALPWPVWGQAGDWQSSNQAQVRLIAGVTGAGQLAEIPLGLEVVLAPGWKTYWRMPGDAGAPPQLDWSVAQSARGNLDHVELLYPVPQRHMAFGLETIGYDGKVVFPIRAVPKQPGKTLRLEVKLTLLTCGEICVPNDYTLRLTIPAGEAAPSAEAGLLAEWRARVPMRDDVQKIWTVTSIKTKDSKTLQLNFATALTLENPPDLFVESTAGGIFYPPDISLDGSMSGGIINLKLRDGAIMPNPPQIRLTFVHGGYGWEQEIALPGAAAATTQTPPLPAALLPMLLFAFLGGLLLNLMPCVLPVLSLKLLKFMGHGGRENRDARQSFLAAGGGIIGFFVLLALGLLGLRALGHSVGWGMQFQHESFLIFIILVLLLFAANLWGLFEIRLPGWINDRLAAAGARPKLFGDFLSGGFAALLATPCTAPFLGTAVGFALGAGAAETIVIFMGMGLGMASPYLLIAGFPGFATRMPRPGAWMLRLRRILACALLVTALWFGNILWLQMQDSAQNFDETAIARHIKDGKTVFVDVTASWCITCQANKRFVLDRAEIKARLAAPGVVFMQRDWTKPDRAIADYLRRYGRGGIPFNIVFGPHAPEGIILPELLTPGAVLEAMDKAGISNQKSVISNQ